MAYSTSGTGSRGDEARADEAIDEDEQARLLHEAGQIAYRQGLFDEAVEKWSRAYELSERPLLLYNLSMALERRYEISGDVEDLSRARSVMQNFLYFAEADPDMEAPDDVKDRIAKLDAMIAEVKAKPARRNAEP